MRAGYKMTELGEIPEEWEVVLLGEYAIVNMGQSPNSDAYNQEGIGKLLIQGNADIKSRRSNPRIWTAEITRTCNVGDIIMTVRAPVGAIAKSLHNACIGRGVCAINSNKMDIEFLYQLLVSYECSWKALEQGSTFTAVNGKDIRSIKFSLPPLPEQQKIASILSTVDEKIEVIDAQITQTRELKKGLMQKLLTRGIGHTKFKDSVLGEIPESWEVVNLVDVCKLQGGYAFKSTDSCEDGIRWLKIANVGINKISWEDKSFLPSDFLAEYAEYVLYEKDVVIAMTRPILGADLKIARIATFDSGSLLNQRVGRLVVNKKLSLDFAYQILTSSNFIAKLQKELLGTDPPNISSSTFESLAILLPPLNEQLEISAIFNALDDKLDLLQTKKETYQQLKKGLMQQLLTGKVRVV